jgi:cell filamentation protein
MSYTQDNEVLKNKLGITSYPELERTTSAYAKARTELLKLGLGPPATFDAAHLTALHKHLFQDIFEWAGRARDQQIQLSDGTIAYAPHLRKGGNTFTFGPDIPGALDRVFAKLAAGHFLRGLTRPQFAAAAAEFLIALNAIHPFREGNGRTQRAMLSQLAARAGHVIAFDVMSGERNKLVSRAAHDGDPSGMYRLLDEITDRERVVALRAVIATLPANWPEAYIATTEVGHRYAVHLKAIAGDHVLAADGDRLLVGWRRDLPAPEPRVGEAFVLVARDPARW